MAYTDGATVALIRTFRDEEWEIVRLDPDVQALSAEVDAIVCAALRSHRCPPAPPATGCAVIRPSSASRSSGGGTSGQRMLAQSVDATQRGPPRPALAIKVLCIDERQKGR